MSSERRSLVLQKPEAREQQDPGLATLLGVLPCGVIESDLEGRFRSLNPAAERLLGLSEAVALGRTALELGIVRFDLAGVAVDATPNALPAFTAAVGHTEPAPRVHRYSGLSVVDVWLEVRTTPLLGATGERLGSLASLQDVSAQVALDETRRDFEQRVDLVLSHAAAGVLILNAEGRIEYANAAALGGRQPSDVIGQLAADPAWRITNEQGQLLAYDALPVPTALRERREVRGVTLGIPTPDGKVQWARITVVPLLRADGVLTGAVVTLDDTTEQRALAAQLAQAQKMDAIGQLAGGIAHDFNNLLTAILGNAELALEATPPGSSLAEDLAEIREAALRGAALTRHVLTFARKQVIQPQLVMLDRLTAGAQKLLERALGEHIVLIRETDATLWPVRIDLSEMEQVIINLAINARDAMPQGGVLVIGTHNRSVDAALADQHGVEAGEYVALSVRDGGMGVPSELLGRIFEPFFTTKPVGSGTGLGLSICYGVAKQARGFITVESVLGRGTTFTVYLPRAYGTAMEPGVASATPLSKGAGTILVIEDEDSVRSLVARVLGAAGYQVFTAAGGPEALALQTRTGVKLDLVITDVVMAHLRGPDLARAIRSGQPNLPVLFITGYTDLADTRAQGFDREDQLLAKPFTPQQLLRRVEQLLGHTR